MATITLKSYLVIKALTIVEFVAPIGCGLKCEKKICLQHNYENKQVDTHANKTIQQFCRISGGK